MFDIGELLDSVDVGPRMDREKVAAQIAEVLDKANAARQALARQDTRPLPTDPQGRPVDSADRFGF